MDYLTIEEICKMLKIKVPDRTTVWRWRNQGMPHVRLGKEIRYEKDAVIKWLKERSNKNEN